MKSPVYLAAVVILVAAVGVIRAGEDYYEILGIGKDADNREIRKAFKKLALKYHPDKSKEENAQETFLKINKAYETLKDEEKRKRYDRFGEEDEESGGPGGGPGGGGGGGAKYQSWNYYHDDFGLYDDDPEIVTLSYNDFRRSVMDTYQMWFVNFYSPQCGHCHDLAPVWRRVARLLNGIVRIGAVNCQDEFVLCRQQNIHSYPSLKFYGGYDEGDGGAVWFQGPKEEEELINFIVKRLPDRIIRLRSANLDKVIKRENEENSDKPWVILFCVEDGLRCPDKQQRHLLSVMLEHLVNFGQIDCNANKKLCKEFFNDEENSEGAAYYFASGEDVTRKNGKKLEKSSEFRELAEEILAAVPPPTVVDDEKYSKIRLKLEDDIGRPWLIHFVFGKDGKTEEDKKLPGLLPTAEFGVFDCKKHGDICKELYIRKPAYCAFKKGGAFEFYYGSREDPIDVADFARSSFKASTLTTLEAADFPSLLKSRGLFVDFFAPWCPPCLNLLPEFRKAASNVGGGVIFGTVDCTTQVKLCNEYGIRSYPTTVFFNMSKPHYFNGEHSAKSLSDFVHETLRPSVVNLDYFAYHRLVGGKSEGEMWLIDFYAPCKSFHLTYFYLQR